MRLLRRYGFIFQGADVLLLGRSERVGEPLSHLFLLDQLEDWQEILELAIAAGNTEIQKKAEKQIAKTNEKLKF